MSLHRSILRSSSSRCCVHINSSCRSHSTTSHRGIIFSSAFCELCGSSAGGVCCTCACRGVHSPAPAVCAAPTPVVCTFLQLRFCLRCTSASRGVICLRCPSTYFCDSQARCPPRKFLAFCLCAPSVEHTDLTVMMDNEALYDTCRRYSDIQLNRLLAEFISHGPHLCDSFER